MIMLGNNVSHHLENCYHAEVFNVIFQKVLLHPLPKLPPPFPHGLRNRKPALPILEATAPDEAIAISLAIWRHPIQLGVGAQRAGIIVQG